MFDLLQHAWNYDHSLFGQWISQGAVAAVTPQDWTVTKIIVGPVVHTC